MPHASSTVPVQSSSTARGYDAVVAALRAVGHRLALHRDHRSRVSIRTTCPAHHDRRPSLVVTREDDGRALIHCFSGCRPSAIVTALGLTVRDLFIGPPVPRGRRVVEATYDYIDLNGVVHGTKVRRNPKGFAWREHDGMVGIYRLPDLADRSTVFLSEGEKAVDRLWSVDLPATCGPNGAGSWAPAWSRDLSTVGCRELVLLPDNDRAGRAHAERVAEITLALDVAEPIVVKVLSLPDLPPNGDIVDWFDAGHDAAELVALAATVPAWSPQLRALQQEAHRRLLRKARNLRYRAKPRAQRETVVCVEPPRETVRMLDVAISDNETVRMCSTANETVRRETIANVLPSTLPRSSSSASFATVSEEPVEPDISDCPVCGRDSCEDHLPVLGTPELFDYGKKHWK